MVGNRHRWFARPSTQEHRIDELVDYLVRLQAADCEATVSTLQASVRNWRDRQFNGNFTNARDLHREVEKHRWSVSLDDLLTFRRVVRQRWEAGRIPKLTTTDQLPEITHVPGHDDPEIGPSMYQVNKYVIQWVTEQVGGMSWALMCNPNGLDGCDLFVSHAWCEGVFEFVTHVLKAWPWKARSLWCCFLANPQCGDLVSELLDVPIAESPFAQAINRTNHVVVVPNQAESGCVYGRLWCVYEMYLATQKGKTVIMPTLDMKQVMWKFWCVYGGCCICSCLGACVMAGLVLGFGAEQLGGASLLIWPIVATESLWRRFLHHGKVRSLFYILFFATGLLGGGLEKLFFFFLDEHHSRQGDQTFANRLQICVSLLTEA
eukprot:CAMPEP_0178452638 /NCGR_PEP_ID=MMETSP0689_2-20121128/44355_1 /TAXON_ID=160604 /ORGANISM="Amphidinium massartii, Strain CS-259" /LENGTH=375 /DNA_ID=CAMNT_0020078365 /DNA_START=207 /DNA_END=1330 /DNA_ORIENTATION=-